MTHRIEMAEGLALCMLAPNADLRVVAEERADVEIDAGDAPIETKADPAKGKLVVKVPMDLRGEVTVRCPEGVDASIASVAGDVRLEGRFGEVTANSKSGSVWVEAATRAELRSVSGAVEVGDCAGYCRLATTSGDAKAGAIGGAVKVCTVSGNVSLGSAGLGDVTVKSISGNVSVSVPADARPAVRCMSLVGRVDCALEKGDSFSLGCKSVSGDIAVVAA